MKVSSKPISSPGRTEKFPPPLMRFLRSNVGSRSRGRRSSPMFVRKKNAAAIETQEPSSPKVTCMGQVRVRRSKQTGAKPGGGKKQAAPTKRRCQWIRNALFCTHFDGKSKNKSFRPSFRKWVSFFHVGSRKKAEVGEESSTIEPKCGEKDEGLELESNEIDYGEEEEDKNFVCPSSTPPRNALLLTRCRSAPYRSSSLANRFWGSPLATEERVDEKGKPVFGNREKHIENRNSTSESEPICGDSTAESRTDRENKCSIDGRTTKSEEDVKTGQVCNVRPLLLTRCKSEPARTAEKLFDPVASY